MLIADDDRNVRNILKMICEYLGCLTLEASNGKEAVEQARTGQPDLILMDGVMPSMDGFDATQAIKGDGATEHIPVIIVTGLQSRDDRIKGISLGANDFLTKPFDREEIALRIKNNLKIKEYHDFLQSHNKILEQRVAERTKELRAALDKLTNANKDAILRLTIVSEERDEDTANHIRRIGHYAREIATAVGMPSTYSQTVFYASLMHDIGKVSIPDSILLKPGKLSAEEWEIMKGHTVRGARILRGAASEYLKMGEEIALTHHENWDGSGYPAGLSAKNIPLSGRITRIVDVYDALRSKRPYKPAMDHETALEIIKSGDSRVQGSHFCPDCRAAFLDAADRIAEIYREYTGTPEELTALD